MDTGPVKVVPSPQDEPRAFLRALFDAAVERASPARVMAAHLPAPPLGRTVVIGAGKAAGAMAAAVDSLWPPGAPLGGAVVTRYGHVPPACRLPSARIEVLEAGHPLPDAAGVQAAQRITSLVSGLGRDDLVLCLLSGGGSALLAMPAPGVTLQDKQAISAALLRCGAPIGEINCVRRHLSSIKGGRLAAMCAPARVVTLLISDVPGDAPEAIASGPTVADPTTCADALAILERHAIEMPEAVRRGLERREFETFKPGDAVFAGHDVRLIATPQQSLQAAAALARQAGLSAHILSDAIEGESREVGKVHAALARAVAQRGEPFARPCVILSGGETTVTVTAPDGRGGRATEFLLGCAMGLQGERGVWVLAADTDGLDGTEDNAGAFVTPDTLTRARALGLDAFEHLEANDAHGYFAPIGDLLVSGPTFTNVNDFRALLIA